VNTDAHQSDSLSPDQANDQTNDQADNQTTGQASTAPHTPLSALPTDLNACHAMIIELLERLAERERNNQRLQHQIQGLLKKLYGRSSEKLSDEDMALFQGMMDKLQPRPEMAVNAAEPAIAPVGQTGRDKHGRQKPPADLPRRQIIHDLPEEQKACPCCGMMRCVIGRDVSEQYDYVPAKVTVLEHVQLKYACKACEQRARGAQITVAEKPLSPIEKGLAAPGLLAQVIVSKYGDHLPLYRLESILERHGVSLSRSTLCDWMAQAAVALAPLYECMKKRVLQSDVIHTDDTPVDALEPRSSGKHTGRFWVYVGDGRNPYTVFDYTASRSRDGPETFLKGWSGYLQADAFTGYDGLYLVASGRKIVEVACWAHARRKFYDARNSDVQASTQALAQIRLLYQAEGEAKEKQLNADSLVQWRKEQSLPRLNEFKRWMLGQQRENGGAILPRSPMGEAITYTLNQWDALCVYCTDGRLAIDNNVAENALRRVTLGRKNWLFVGSDQGGTTAAVLYSLISSCQRHRVEPWAYMRDVLTRIPSLPKDQMDTLLPDQWQTPKARAQDVPPPQAMSPSPDGGKSESTSIAATATEAEPATKAA
jgi:transposase